VVNLPRVALVAFVPVLFLLTACGGELGPTQQPAVRVGPELADLGVKLRALQADQCQTVPADTVFGDCERFVTEVVNLSASVRTATATTPRAGDVAAAADKLATAGDDYQRRQCGVSTPAPDAGTCARDLTTVRDTLTGLGSIIDQLAGH